MVTRVLEFGFPGGEEKCSLYNEWEVYKTEQLSTPDLYHGVVLKDDEPQSSCNMWPSQGKPTIWGYLPKFSYVSRRLQSHRENLRTIARSVVELF